MRLTDTAVPATDTTVPATSSAVPARRHPSLRGQLLVRLLPVVIGLFALSGALSFFGARYYANLVHDRWLQDSAEALALRITAHQGQAMLDLPEAAREILQWDATDTTWFEIVGERRGHIAGQLGLPRHGSGGAGAGAGAEKPDAAVRYDGQVGPNPVRVASITLIPKGTDETVQVLVAETLRKRQALATELMLSVLLPEVILLITAVGVIAWTLRRMLLPIGRVAEALEAQTHHSLEPLDDRDLPAEVVPLTHAMNRLLFRLKEALQAQRQFIADAAHQLRTPLTALKLHTDEAARETDPGRLRPLIADLQNAADRTVRLSNQLLALARAEPSAGLTERRRVDLRQTVVETAGHWIPTALAQGIDLGLDTVDGPPLAVNGDPMLLAEAINNLIDNAIKYGRPRGRITVAVGSDRKRAWFSVLDDGPGIPAAERRRVLERFQRLDPARPASGPGARPHGTHGTHDTHDTHDTRDQPTGSGLGLAIVTEIARSHAGQVTLSEPAEGTGLLVMVDLPLASFTG